MGAAMDGLKAGSIEGRAALSQALRDLLLLGCAQGSRTICCVAERFDDWPLSDRTVIEALAAWARRGRTLQLMGRGFDGLYQRHPRFVQWRVTYDHCVEAREYEPQGGDIQSPLAALFFEGGDSCMSLRILDDLHWRGVVSDEPRDAVLLREWFDALAQRASPSFPASTLGL